MAAGNYTATITDAKGCKVTASATVAQPAVLTSTVSKTDIICYGDATGAASVTPNGGTSPYSYSWSSGETTQNISSIIAGTYTVTVTDAKGCTSVSSTTVTQAPQMIVTTTILQNASCNLGNNGSITVAVSGGKSPYSISWNNGSTSQTISGLPVGVYEVTITDSLGCVATSSSNIFIESPAQIFLSTTNVYCQGDSSGTISVHHISGQSPYTYNWSTGQTTQNISGITIGNYSVTVTDNRGCSVSASTSITQYSNLVGAISYTDANNGNNGTASVQVYGGTAPYTYSWTTGATTSGITGLAPGTYGVIITDSKGNFTNETVQINALNSISTGSFIVNLGITPQTIYNGLKPYGLVADLVRNFNVPVKWIINTTKAKDGIDFNYNGTDFRGSAFVIESQYRTPVVNSVISGWVAQGVVGVTTTSQLTLPVYGVITTFSNLVIDQQNEQLVTPYFSNASIPQTIYRVGLPSNLDLCDDTYILPHADPTWATHNYLLTFNTTLKGFIWAGCHAVSVLEGISNPADPNDRLNFLSTSGLKCFGNGQCGSLITETHNGSPTTPYTYILSCNSLVI